MSIVLDYLKAVASEFCATVTSEESNFFTAHIDVFRPGGGIEVFDLRIVDNEAFPKVYECEPRRLPAWCLERHILGDGWFCMSWNPGEPSAVSDEPSARAFWSRLDRFLQSQVTASTLGKWPAPSNARAHGGDAAMFQQRAEEIAAQFGVNLLRDLRRGELTVVRVVKSGKVRLELLRHGRRVARLALKGGLVTTMTRCFCDTANSTRAPIGACGDHAKLAPELIRAIYCWRKEHAEFVRERIVNGRECCGSLEVCELRSAGALVGAKRSIREHAA
jgi:hypothetical protein